MKARFLVPLVVFLALIVLFYKGLSLNPREVPSPLINKPSPEFALPTLHDPERLFSRRDLLGKVTLFNVWASWCVACREEHPLLVEVSKHTELFMVGLNYKDQRPDALGWLNSLGNPYDVSISDTDGRVGIDWGVYGVPETFIVDKKGVIRHKHIGPISVQAWQKEIQPMIEKLEAEQG